MRKSKVWCVCAAMSLGSVAPAFAQDYVPPYPTRIRPGTANIIQSTFSMSILVDRDRDSAAAQDAALSSLYQMAGRSCKLVLESIASKCQIVNMTTNVRGDETRETGNRLTLNAQVTMQVEFKSP